MQGPATTRWPRCRAADISSLSSVLNEVIHGQHRALSSYRDAAAPPDLRLASTNAVNRDDNRSQNGSFRDALEEAREQQRLDDAFGGRRSDMEFINRRRWLNRRSAHQQQQERQMRTSLLDFQQFKVLRRTPPLSNGTCVSDSEVDRYKRQQVEHIDVVNCEDSSATELSESSGYAEEEIDGRLSGTIILENEETLPILACSVRPSMSLDSIDFHLGEDTESGKVEMNTISEALSMADRSDGEDDENDECDIPTTAFQQLRDIDLTSHRAHGAASWTEEEREQTQTCDSAMPRENTSHTAVAAFLGGYKSASNRTRRSRQDGAGLARAVRRKTPSNKSVAAEIMLKEERVRQRLREARARIPPEFRDSKPVSPTHHRLKNPFRNKRVRFDDTKYCREFVVEDMDENEDDNQADGVLF